MSLQLVVFVSGRGSNLEAILKAIAERRLDARVNLVVSNDPQAKALDIAREHNVPTAAISNQGLSRKEHEEKVLAALKEVDFDFIVLAGYMRILSAEFLRPFLDRRGYYRIINIHPSLLPAFPGKNAYELAFNYGVKISGITVHLIDEQVDHGAILAQESFQRLPGDTLETFTRRGLAVEHELYPRVLNEIAKHGIEIASGNTHGNSTVEPKAELAAELTTKIKESVER
ncbi:MAG TPA: phosphoribosylglycinamide formyltransferase [Chroococcales cyanobacterium]